MNDSLFQWRELLFINPALVLPGTALQKDENDQGNNQQDTDLYAGARHDRTAAAWLIIVSAAACVCVSSAHVSSLQV